MRLDFRMAVSKDRESILPFVWCFQRALALQRDVFRFRSFSTFRETTSERVMQFLSTAMAPVVNQSGRAMTRLIFEVNLGQTNRI